MKNSIIYLGIAVLSLTHSITAKAFAMSESTTNVVQIDSFTIKSAVPVYYASQDSTILNPESLIAANYLKSDLEIIAADNQIIENTNDDDLPSFQFKSYEEIISDDSKIIDAEILSVQELNTSACETSKLNLRKSSAKL